MQIECVARPRDVLGEGPIWNEREQTLYWCDNIAGKVHRYDPATRQMKTWDTPEEIGSLVFRENGGIVAAMKRGFSFVDLDAGRYEHVADADSGPTKCMNDGKCDRRGRYWCGSINRDVKTPDAGLYRLDPDLTVTQHASGIIASNGIAFSPDDRTMYYADSRANTVWAYDFDIESGSLGNRRVFLSTDGMEAKIDGATCDIDGNYWCAHIYDWDIACYSPQGRLIRKVRMPVRHPTMCTFGGADLDVMYVTSATRMAQPADLQSQHEAGNLFEIRGLGTRGLPEPRFAG